MQTGYLLSPRMIKLEWYIGKGNGLVITIICYYYNTNKVPGAVTNYMELIV